MRSAQARLHAVQTLPGLSVQSTQTDVWQRRNAEEPLLEYSRQIDRRRLFLTETQLLATLKEAFLDIDYFLPTSTRINAKLGCQRAVTTQLSGFRRLSFLREMRKPSSVDK